MILAADRLEVFRRVPCSFLPGRLQCGRTQKDRPRGRRGIDLADLGIGAGRADTQLFGLSEPAFPLGFGDPGQEDFPDLPEAAALGRAGAQEGAADAGFFEPVTTVC